MTPTAPNGRFYSLIPDAFMAGLPALLRTKNNLQAIFLSYNPVTGFKNGNVDACPPGLSIKIAQGDWNGGSDQMLVRLFLGVASGNADTMQRNMDTMHSVGTDAYKEATAGVLTDATDGDVLIVAYMGLSAQAECAAQITQARQLMPQATIVLLMCDCCPEEKTATLRDKVPDGVINFLLVTSECGGKHTMGAIVRSLMEQWPTRELKES